MLNIDIPIIVHIQVNCGSQYINNVDIPNMQSVDVTSGKSQHPLSHAIYPPPSLCLRPPTPHEATSRSTDRLPLQALRILLPLREDPSLCLRPPTPLEATSRITDRLPLQASPGPSPGLENTPPSLQTPPTNRPRTRPRNTPP